MKSSAIIYLIILFCSIFIAVPLYAKDKKLQIIIEADLRFHSYSYHSFAPSYISALDAAEVKTYLPVDYSISENESMYRAVLFASRLSLYHYGEVNSVLSYSNYINIIDSGTGSSPVYDNAGVCIDIHYFISQLLNKSGIDAAVMGNVFVNSLAQHAITLGRTSDERYFLIDYGNHYQGGKNLFDLINYYHVRRNSFPAGRIAIRDEENNTHFYYIPQKAKMIRAILGFYDPYHELNTVLLDKNYFGPEIEKRELFDNILRLKPGSGNIGTWLKAEYSMFFVNAGYLYPSLPYDNQNFGYGSAGADFKGNLNDFFKWSARLYGFYAHLTKEPEDNNLLGFGFDLLMLLNISLPKKVIFSPLFGVSLTRGSTILGETSTIDNDNDPLRVSLSDKYIFFGGEFTFTGLHFSIGTHNFITTDLPPPLKEEVYFFSESKIFSTIFFNMQSMKFLMIPGFAIRPEAFRAEFSFKLEKIASGIFDVLTKIDYRFSRSIYYPDMLVLDLTGKVHFTPNISASLSLLSNHEFWGTESIYYNHGLDVKCSVSVKM